MFVEVPLSLVLNQTASGTFTCSAKGLPPPTISWTYANGISLNLDSRIQILDENAGVDGEGLTLASSILTVPNSNVSDNGTYYCIATGGLPTAEASVSASFTIFVQGE